MKKITILLSLFLLTSCYFIRYPLVVPKNIKELYTQCYSNEAYKDIPIRLDGYYGKSCSNDENRLGFDNCISSSFMFYKDGSVAKNVLLLGVEEKKPIINKEYLYSQVRPWGTYTIKSDSIIVQVIHNVHNLQNIHEYTFKVINNTKLQLISDYVASFDSTNLTESRCEITEEDLYEFYPLEDKPINNHFWLKNKKWFWCDEQEYKEYLRELREKELEAPMQN